MKHLIYILLFVTLNLIPNLTLQSQNKGKGFLDMTLDSLLIKEVTGKVHGQSLIEKSRNGEKGNGDYKGFKISVYENDKNLVETTYSNEYGTFVLRKLEYDKYYYLYFSKEGYYERKARLYTTGVPDSIKNIRFEIYLGTALAVGLYQKIKTMKANPFESDYAVLLFKQNSFSGKTSKGLGNHISLIREDEAYKKTRKEEDIYIRNPIVKDYSESQNEKIQDFELKLKFEESEKTRINQEKTILEQSNKLKASEIQKVKALSIAKEKELELSDKDNKLKASEIQKIKALSIAKEKELELANKDKRIKDTEIKQQTVLRNGFIVGFILMILFAGLIYKSYRTKRKDNVLITHQKQLVEEQRNEIVSSIQYAKRIQSAILPPIKVVKDYLQESFILYKPKDIVAGDFYWMEHKDNKVLFAAADCTGHGVPGAMVSVVCNNALNRSVREYGLTDPGEILNKTREIVVAEFEKSEEEVKDGMDIALCSLEGNKLQYAGAHNPLWIIRNGVIIETKANKQPIGQFDNPEPYTTHSFDLELGDAIYIFSDGYV
ncbi:MAG: hypothetical protein ACI9N1_002856, partial [Flavobacteriales bacterium]